MEGDERVTTGRQNAAVAGGNPISWTVENDGSRLRVVDSIERRQLTFTPEEGGRLSVADVAREWFVPVDRAATLGVSTLWLPTTWDVFLRAPDGTLLADIPAGETGAVTDKAVAEVTTAPIKIYFASRGGLRVSTVDGQTRLEGVGGTPLVLGARSPHEQPARTITVPPTPEGYMRGVSEFGAALKTASPERTFPTLRGYPPEIQIGSELDIPQGPQRPETGVTLRLPRTVETVFAAAPLAYFLGAEIEPGRPPRLELDGDRTVPIDSFGATTPEALHRLLVHTFTLDCVARTEGQYPMELSARRTIEAAGVRLDWEAIYEKPLADRLAAFLSVDLQTVEAAAPDWRLTADIPETDDSGPLLPHLANELADIRTYPADHYPSESRERASTGQPSVSEQVNDATDTLLRGADPRPPGGESGAVNDRVPRSVEDASATPDVFRIRRADSILQVYAGNGVPIGANKITEESYLRHLSETPDETAALRVVVVCNDTEMLAEASVEEIYSSAPLLSVTGELRTNLTVDSLRDLLQSDIDLIHYIGHVSERGLSCADGHLDIGDLDAVSAQLFILNGCRSFRQGEKLVENGALAGVGTLQNVNNQVATEMGKKIAQLLQHGWPLAGALSLLRFDAIAGQEYTVLGDGTAELVSADSGVPACCLVEPTPDGEYRVSIDTYLTRVRHLGTIFRPSFGEDDVYHLAGGEVSQWVADETELRELFERENAPVQLRRERSSTKLSLRWSHDLAEDMSPLSDGLTERMSPSSPLSDSSSKETTETD
ncbi:hypothetical protein BRC71_03950 [Halobacteriales archaeon QH_7_65_31]|nr:MAG: hypothetical protein BRC71_03950 [Halobacteriales archaeon QH_7_65_31]